MKIHKFGPNIEYWYDPHVRVWYAMAVDNEGNQVGDTIDAGQKESLLFCLRRGDLNHEVDRIRIAAAVKLSQIENR